MRAGDIMVSPVVTLYPSLSVRNAAKTFLERHISGAPVVDDDGTMVGIVSEGDLLHRVETDTERNRSSWLRLLTADEALAAEYVKARARTVADVMTRNVISVTTDTPLKDIAEVLERNSIKRVPVLASGRLVGIITRSNLIQVLATTRDEIQQPLSDSAIRTSLLSHLKEEPWSDTWQLNVTVNDGVVDIWGICRSDTERDAVRIAATNIPGVRAVNNHLCMERPFAPTL
jgi:CBS domain-containing protein